jgi:hypothetical protein
LFVDGIAESDTSAPRVPAHFCVEHVFHVYLKVTMKSVFTPFHRLRRTYSRSTLDLNGISVHELPQWRSDVIQPASELLVAVGTNSTWIDPFSPFFQIEQNINPFSPSLWLSMAFDGPSFLNAFLSLGRIVNGSDREALSAYVINRKLDDFVENWRQIPEYGGFFDLLKHMQIDAVGCPDAYFPGPFSKTTLIPTPQEI